MITLDEDLHAFLLAQAVTTLLRQSRSLSCSVHMQISPHVGFQGPCKETEKPQVIWSSKFIDDPRRYNTVAFVYRQQLRYAYI
jgi:hypothetical protein